MANLWYDPDDRFPNIYYKVTLCEEYSFMTKEMIAPLIFETFGDRFDQCFRVKIWMFEGEMFFWSDYTYLILRLKRNFAKIFKSMYFNYLYFMNIY
jgi:hypothetical protein